MITKFSDSVFIYNIAFRFTHISALDAISFLFHSELESRRCKGSAGSVVLVLGRNVSGCKTINSGIKINPRATSDKDKPLRFPRAWTNQQSPLAKNPR